MITRASFVVLVCGALFAQETTVELLPSRSTVDFVLGASLHSVHGSFKVKGGSVRFDPTTGKAAGQVTIDVASGETGSDGRDKRMHKDILESDRFPEAVFLPDRISGTFAPQGASELNIHGVLRIHGGEHEMEIHAQVVVEKDQIIATAKFVVPYVKWGMKNPSTFVLRVSDKVDVETRVAGAIRSKAR